MQTLMSAYRKVLADMAGFAADTVENYETCLGKFFDFATHRLGIDPLQADGRDLLKWITHLKGQGLSRSRLTHHKAALKHLFDLLINQKQRKSNPAELLFTPRKKQSDRNHPISADILINLLRAMKRDSWLDERNFMILSMLWALGLRIAELTSLKVSSFEPDHEPENCIGLLRVPGKGGKERALFVTDKLYVNLMGYLNHPHSSKQKTSPMFPIHNNSNKAISTDRARRMIREVTAAAGLDNYITPHVLRHSFATHMYEANIPVEAIEAMLGHASTDETSIYIHVPEQHKRRALDKIRIEGLVLSQVEGSQSCQ